MRSRNISRTTNDIITDIISIANEGVRKELLKLKIFKSMGPDDIHSPHTLKPVKSVKSRLNTYCHEN